MRVTFVHTELANKTGSAKSFCFKPVNKLNFTAGQFIELTLPHRSPDSRGIKRWFTISSSPTEDIVCITTKISISGSSTFKLALNCMQPGDEVNISEPMGDFVLPRDDKLPILFVAGGIGITPMLSISKWLIDTNQRRDITLLYAVKNEGEAIYTSLEAKNCGINLIMCYSDPPSGWQGPRGLITHSLILSQMKATHSELIYMAGPESMVESMQSQLLASDINPRQLVLDFFPGYLN